MDKDELKAVLMEALKDSPVLKTVNMRLENIEQELGNKPDRDELAQKPNREEVRQMLKKELQASLLQMGPRINPYAEPGR